MNMGKIKFRQQTNLIIKRSVFVQGHIQLQYQDIHWLTWYNNCLHVISYKILIIIICFLEYVLKLLQREKCMQHY